MFFRLFKLKLLVNVFLLTTKLHFGTCAFRRSCSLKGQMQALRYLFKKKVGGYARQQAHILLLAGS